MESTAWRLLWQSLVLLEAHCILPWGGVWAGGTVSMP